jgi:hypothetical protein
LYAGTEWGMYVSFDDGANWQPFQLNLPLTSIRDLHIRDESLIAATHGRSFWMIDDLGPIRQLSKEIASKSHHLYEPKPAYRMAQSGGWGTPNYRLEGENHPNGVLFQFFIKDYDQQKVSLEILDGAGNSIQTYTSDAKEKKQKLKVKKDNNRFVWDMRYPGFLEFDGMVLYSSPNRGPKAVPGTYTAILKVDDAISETTFEIVPDPRLETTQEDYEKQLAFLLDTRDKVSEAHQAIIDIRSIREDIEYFKEKLEDKPTYTEFLEGCEDLNKEMSVIENNIHMTKNQSRQDPLNYGIRINNRLAFLLADQQRGDYRPTDQALAVYQAVSTELDTELNRLDELLEEKLGEINELGKTLGVQILSDRVLKKMDP